MATAEKIAASLMAAIGANDEESTVDQYLSTGYPELDFAVSSKFTNGGLPVGRIVEIAGPPSAGKTAVATVAMATAQKLGGVAGFMDHERSFSLTLAPKLGLDTTPGRFVFKKPRTFEESLTICVKAATHIRAKKLIPPEAPICWVFDSLASMVPHSALFDSKTGKEKEAGDRNMNDNTALARATSAHMPAFSQHCEELGICAIFLNQVRKTLNSYGAAETTPGGEAPKFYASLRIMLSAKKIQKGTGADADVTGSEITARIIKNKVARPFLRATWRFVFEKDGTGKFDVMRSTIDFLVREGIMTDVGQGRVDWNGVKLHRDALARQLEKDGKQAELFNLLPSNYEPPIVSEVDLDEDDAEAA